MSERVALEPALSTAHGELILQIGAVKPAVERQINSSFAPWLRGGVQVPDVVCTQACIPRPVFIFYNLPPFRQDLWAVNPNVRSAHSLHMDQLGTCLSFVRGVPSIQSDVRANVSKFVRESLQ